MAGARRMVRIGAPAAVLAMAAGCSFVPKARLDDCHLRAQALQSETARLKDETLSLRNKNRDLVQRALDDAHRVHALEQANARLEHSITAYQDERDRLVESFEQLERQVQLAADFPTTAMRDRVESYARAHPRTRFDARTNTWSVPAEALFQDGTDRLRPEATLLLRGFANLLDVGTAAGGGPLVRIVSRASEPSVQTVALKSPPPESSPRLASSRAKRVRDLLVQELKVDRTAVQVQASERADTADQDVVEFRLESESGVSGAREGAPAGDLQKPR